VFQGFHATPVARGRVEYVFHWRLRRPTRATFDRPRNVLSFPGLFPGLRVGSDMARALDEVVEARQRRTTPAHKRLDGRLASLAAAVRRGDWGLTVSIRGANHEYAVRHALSLVNELFLLLQERYPEYLIARFGLSAE